MKILHISPNFPYPPNDGGKIVIYNFYKYIQKPGNEIDFLCINKNEVLNKNIICFDQKNPPKVIIDKGISSYSRIFKYLFSNKPYLIYKFYSKKLLSEIINSLKRKDYDILHFEGLHSVPYALNINSLTSSKIVIRLHNIESQIIQRYFEKTRNPLLKIFFNRENNLIKKVEAECYKKFKNIVFITEEDKIIAKTIYPYIANPYVLSAGVDVKYFDRLENRESLDLLYLGSMDWKPNEDAVIWFIKNVFSKLVRKYPELKFYIVGKNPTTNLKNYSSKNIIVSGTVVDVRPYIKKSGICIIPLKVGGGMRVKILELMASNKPIITSRLGAEGINYEENEDILLANNEEEFYNQIDFLINNPEKRFLIGCNARNKAANLYSWESLINKYEYFLSNSLL
ncbi:MAG: hypothetical protein C0425_03120 [Chlorobiaceae bacterium]|nr:hypothetical protein [Chlorobiaceae bacterium]MBA4309311.1 hypothetical protein [Chlorobiaceae bacterium]